MGSNDFESVAEVMGTELFTLTPDTVVGSALRLAEKKKINHFLVIEDGSLTGIVTQGDMRQVREASLVEGCMKSPVLCIGPETTIKEARDIMDENEVGCLPVVTGAFLVGVVNRTHVGASEPDVFEELDPAPRVEPRSCVMCGSAESVRLDLSSGAPLCTSCRPAIAGN